MKPLIIPRKTIYITLLAAIVFINNISAQTDTTKQARDSIALLKLIEQQMQSAPQMPQQAVPQQTRSGISANPDIGVVADFRGSYISKGKRNFDAYLNETELSFQSVVDPYIRADFFISLGRDPDTHKYGASVEEGYLTSLSLPAKLQLKVGKFRQAVGKINPTHPHALPFIDLPNAYTNYFGEEGLNDEGLSLSWLVPNKAFYQELVFQATSGAEESPTFFRGDNNRAIYLGHLKNFFTLSENATLEFGLTGITGPNDSSSVTNIVAADLTYKWKPVQMNTYKTLVWQTEFFYGNAKYNGGKLAHNSLGMYSFVETQLSQRWFLTGRYDYAQKPYDRTAVETAYSLTAGWLATEFQKIEFEGKFTHVNVNTEPDYSQCWIRWIFVIGAHGAHQY